MLYDSSVSSSTDAGDNAMARARSVSCKLRRATDKYDRFYM